MAKSYLDSDGLLYLWTLLKSKFLSLTGGTISGNLTVTGTTTLSGTATAPTPSSSANNTQIATTAFVNTLVNNKIAAADAMIYKGTIGTGGTVTALPATHKTGWTYKVITAGTYAGQACEVGDMIVCLTDGTAASDADWTVIQSNIDGAVIGPASATDAHVATFSGATGKVIKDSGFTIAKSVPSTAVFTDTHYTTNLIAGASATATANAAATNGNVYLNILDNTTIRASHNIVGSGATTVVSDATGKITINSTNTTYSTFAAATADAAGSTGLVPAPAAGKQTSFLRGDGTWVIPTNTTYSAAKYNTLGLVKPSKSYTAAATLTTAAATASTAPTLNAITSTASRYYAVEIDSAGVPFVNVPWSNTTYSNASLGSGFGTCATAAATVEKAVTLSSYALVVGGIVSVKFTYAVPAAATLNVNSKGAKPIFYKGAAITANIIAAGVTASFMYDGTNYNYIGKDVDNNTTYSAMTAATASTAGKTGLVPAPPAGSNTMFLTGAGTFAEPTSITNTEIDTILAS